MPDNLTIGRIGEDIAEKYLGDHGYGIIERNWRSKRWGEIDLVAAKDNTLIFIEVKTRIGSKYGEPEAAVRYHKLRALKRAGQYYKLIHPKTPDAFRIDVISIILESNTLQPLQIKLFTNAS